MKMFKEYQDASKYPNLSFADEKYIRSFFPVNYIDLFRLKTVATGNYEAETELNYRIGSFLILF